MASKIIIAEDDQFVAKAMLTKLTKEGFEVKIVSDGVQLMELLKSYIPDLIILDLLMPKKDGFEVLTAMKADAKLKDIPVIMLTNLGEEADVKRARKLGASDYMIKAHFLPSEVIAVVKKYLK